MENLSSWIWTLIGVVWLLPLINLTFLGETASLWISALGVLVIGVTGLMKK